jgi:ribosomal protein S7
VKYVKIAVKERNWRQLVKDVLNLIAEAEEYTNLSGDGKKQFVIESVKEMTETINYEISEEELSALIDSIVAITNKVNVDKIKIQ